MYEAFVCSQPSRCTLAVQTARLLPSRGIQNKQNARSWRLEHPTAAQRGIFDKYQQLLVATSVYTIHHFTLNKTT
jgi:hypothetical protein